MRQVLLEVRHTDKEAELAARRIITALDITDPEAQTALDDITSLIIQIRDLQRRNLCLEFLNSDPEFDVDQQLKRDRLNISSLANHSRAYLNLCARYDYNFFIEYFHPDYIVSLCTLLLDTCDERHFTVFPLWTALRSTNGFITKDIADKFGHVEVDEGLV